MAYAIVADDGTIRFPYRVPNVLRTGERDYDLRAMTADVLNPHGIYEVAATERPADTATATHDRTIELVDGIPTVVWTERPKTQAELDADAERENRNIIDQAIEDSLTRLQQLADAPALPDVPAGTMTTATLSEVCRQLRDHAQATRVGAQEVALTLRRTIRLVRGDFDGTD